MTRTSWAWARIGGGAVILAVIVWRLGTGPIIAGVRSVNAGSLAAAVAISAVATVCAAWRWTCVASGLGIELSLRAAIAAYYRSQFLNVTLPGGVLGDVHRAVRHGHDAGDLGRGVRAVVWERTAGQVVQVTIALIVLLLVPSPVRSFMPTVVVLLVLAVAVLGVLARKQNEGRSRWARAVRAARADVRCGLLARTAWPGTVIASVVAVIGHASVFLLAAHTAGSSASTLQLLPIVMLVLLATAVPTNIGGWGPRDGVAAWAFAAAGLGAGAGIATAAVYGVLVCAAALPGALVLVTAWLMRGHRPDSGAGGEQAPRLPEGAVRG